MTQLATETDEARASENFLRYLDVMSKFHNYSFNNQMLILLQNPEATKVMGYRQWNKMNRYVKRGEHGLKILAPMLRKPKLEQAQEQSDGEGLEVKVLTGFMPVTVFDISQTDGEPLPSLEILMTGDDFGYLASTLEDYCSSMNIQVRYEELSQDVYGESRGGTVAVADNMARNAKVGVLVHEVAHELLHKTESERLLPRQVKELHAEAVSYVVCRHFGLEPKSSNYLALYRADSDKIMQNMAVISDTSRQLIEYLEKKLSKQEVETK